MRKIKHKLKSHMTKNNKQTDKFQMAKYKILNTKYILSVVVLLIIALAFGILFYQQTHKVKKAELTPLQSYVSKVALPKKDLTVKRTVQKEAGYTFITSEKGNVDAPVSFAAKGGEISFTSLPNQNLGGLNSSDVEQTKDGKTIYSNIYNGINLIYTPSSNGILEEYEVKVKRPLTNIIQKIDITGLSYKQQKDGSILFYNKDNQFAFAIPKPVMYEEYNTKNRSYGLHYEIFTYKGETFLAKVIDSQGQEWLSKTNYPVMIDATILLTLFSYQSYPTTAGNWQVSIDTVGNGDLKIQPTQGSTWSDLSLVSITCGGANVQYSNSNGIITIPNYSCSQNTIVTTKVADPSKQYNLSFSWSGHNTVISNTVYNGKPVIISSSLNPAVVKIGDTITVKTEVADQNGVKSVKADMGGIQTIDLTLTSGTPQDGTWQGQWKVEGTGTKPYETIITASNDTQSTSNSIGFFDPYTCTGGGDHAGAAWDPATDCTSGLFAGNHTNIGAFSVGTSETATLTSFNGTSYGIATVSATSVSINGTLTANGSGFPGNPPVSGITAPGGSHGGVGGTSSYSIAGPPAYDSLTYPGQMGQGGKGGQSPNPGGGSGGGAIQIITSGTFSLATGAVISVDGTAGQSESGGGAGGGIYISAASLSGGGTISAKGGAGGSYSGGGGGGRIAVYYTGTNSFTGSITVAGGTAGGSGGLVGGDGTSLLENSNTNDITIPSNNSIWNASDMNSWSFNNLTINGNVTFQPSNGQQFIATSAGTTTIATGVVITLNSTNNSSTQGTGSGGKGVYLNLTGNVTLPATSSIVADSQGYQGGVSVGGITAPGGSHGGVGGTSSQSRIGAASYDSLLNPTDLGGGGQGGQGAAGANGGGAVKVITTGTLTINGTISSNGGNAGYEGGGGAGGSIYVSAGTLGGTTGSVTANGGTGGQYGGGGGGGRIVLTYSTANNYSGAVSVNGNTAANGGTGGTGTYILYDSANNNIHINTTQSWKPNSFTEGATISAHAVFVENNSTLTLQGYNTTNTDGIGFTFNVTDFTVIAGATVSMNGTGYAGGAANSKGSGPGGGANAGGSYNNGGNGGTYGGIGGTGSNTFQYNLNPNSNVGGTYGSLTAPVDLGSGGGGGDYAGGAGGGAIYINATGTVSVAGTVSANGANGISSGNTSGGGSGGSIYIKSSTFTGNGTITATGGNGATGGNWGGFAGNGAGGRIAIYYSSSNSYSGIPTVNTGTGGAAGNAGTVFIENSSTHDMLIPANNYVWKATDRTNWNFASLTINGNVTFQGTNAQLMQISVAGATTIATGVTINAYGSNTTNTNGVGVYFNLSGNVTIPATSVISANGGGYGSAAGVNGYGSGGGAHASGSYNPGGNGGAYGGIGGIGNNGMGSPNNASNTGGAYGSQMTPTDLGSGGGGGDYAGGAGGGAVRITTPGTLTVNGTISANGANGVNSGNTSGGGSGGSVYITVGILGGNGIITANGGNGGTGGNWSGYGGGGGGGRVTIYYNTANSWGGNALTAVGATTAGTGASPANGVVYVAQDNVPTMSNLAQYQTDCTNSVAVGATLQGDNQGATGCFKATLSNSDSSDSFIYQLEAQPIGTSFTNYYTASSSAVAFSGSQVTASVSEPGFTLGVAYHWQYRVLDSVGSSTAWTSFGGNAESAADFVSNVPAPANITGTYNSDSQITVTWTNTALNVINFEIQRSTNGGAYVTVGTTADGNTLTFVDNATNNPGSPPIANKKYQYQVRSTFSGYNSDYGTASLAVYTTPAAPSGVTIYQTAVGSITINWTNNASYPSNFTVQRKIGSGSYATISSTVSPTATSFVDTNVQQNSTYSYQLSATRITPNVLASSYAQSSGSVNNTLGFGKGIYLTQNGTLVVQNNFKNSVDIFNNIQNDTTDKVGQSVAYDSTTPASGPNLPTGSTINGLAVKEGVSSADGKSNVIYVATSNGLVAIHENSTSPVKGGVKYYTNNYVTEMMYGDIRGMWPLDASASSGLTDASNKAQTLTNNGGTTFTAGGIRGTAATLNGTTQYLSITDNANLSVTGNLSFGAWFKTTSTSSAQTIMAKNGSYSLGLTSSGTLTASIIGVTTGTVTGSTVLDTGWHQADVVYDSSAQSITLYLDGKVEGTTTASVPSSITDSAGAFNIGANAGAALFAGNIDEPFVTATAINAGEVAAMNLNGLRSLQNHPGNIIAGVATNNYQRLLGNGAGVATVNNVQTVAVDDGNQFIYAGTNDLSGNTGGTTAIGVHSDSVADLYSAGNTLQKDDQGNAFSANDAVAISVTGIPNPGFNTNSDYSQNGGTVAIAGTNDTATRLYIRNQSYSLTQVLAQGGAVGGSKNSFNVGNLFTVGNLLGNSASTSGEVLQTPAFQIDQNGIVIQNYLGTDTTQTVATFNGGALTSGTIFNISGSNLTSGTGLNLTSSSTNFTGSLANFSLSATGSGTTGNVMSLTNYSSGGGNTLNVQSIGTGVTNVALYASASGATNNYAALFPSGYVGIGTTSPTSALDIVGNASTSGQLTFRGSSSSINGLNGYGLTFKVSSGGDAGLTTAMFINSTGNLGIGTISPTATLDVNGSASIAGQLTFENGFGTIQATNNQLLTLGGNSTGDIQFKPGNSSSLTLFANGAVGIGTASATNKLDIAGGVAIGSYAGNTAPLNGLIVSGNVGIGTNNPGARLEVKGTSQSVLMGDWGGGTNYAAISLNGSLTTGNYNFISGTGDPDLYINRPSGRNIRFRENNTDQVIIQATTGNVGIGTTGPATALEVSRATSDLAKLTSTTGGAGNKAYLDFQTYPGSGVSARIGAVDYGTYNGGLVFEVNPGYGSNSTRTTEAVRINQNGQVGIGTATPVGLFNVSGTSSGQALFNLNYLGTDQNIMTASVSGITKFKLDSSGGFTSSAGAQWKTLVDSTTALQIANSAGSSIMNFDTSNSRVGIGTTSPSQALDINGALNLFSNSNSRGDIYAGTNLDQRWNTSATFNTSGATLSAGMQSPVTGNKLSLNSSSPLTGWAYRKAVTVNNSTNSATLTNYQVQITTDTATLISQGKMNSDCSDMRFTDTDGTTILNYWIETGCNTASTLVWVKVPSISASSTKTIYEYYGNSSGIAVSSIANTFVADVPNLSLAYRLDEGGGNATDYSGNNNTGVPTGSTVVSGKYNNGRNFSANSDVIKTTTPVSYGTSWSTSIWLNFPLVVTGQWRSAFVKLGGTYHALIFDSSNNMGIYNNSFSSSGYNVGSLSGWHQVVEVATGGTTSFYIDGTVVGTASAEITNQSITDIGNFDGGSQEVGKVDEPRIYSAALTQTQITALAQNYGYVTPNYAGHELARVYSYPEPYTTVGSESGSFSTGDQFWTSQTLDAGSSNTYRPNYLTVNYTLDGTDNIAPKFQVLGSNTGTFTGEQTIYPAGPNTYYQAGGTYPITNGTALDISPQVTNRFRYWKVQAYLNTGANVIDTPAVTSVRLQDYKPAITTLANGFVGLGTTTPQFKLDVADAQGSTLSAMVRNLNAGSTAGGLGIQLAGATPGVGNYFLSFLDGNGDIVGKVQGNGSGGVTYATNGIDFAEYFRRENSTESLNQGDVVCLGSTGGVTKCINGNRNILGVVSGKAGFVGGGEHDQDPNYIIIGLIGQLPVNVSTESGQIDPGDSLTVDNNGIVIKAKSQGQIVGQALEGYSGAGDGKVNIRINVSWYDPNPLANNNSQNSSSSGTLSDLVSRIDILSGNISTLQNFFAFNSTASAFLNSATSATGAGTLLPSDQLDIANATISGKLMVLGRTTLSDLGVTGKINSGLLTINGFDDSVNSGQVTINTLAGDLYLQNKGLGGVNILNGLVTIDTSGNMNITGVLGAGTVRTQKLIMQGDVGSAVLPAGATQVEIDNPDVASTSKVFVTLRTLVNVPLIVDSISTGKFIVKIPSAQASDVKFDWWIIATQ